MRSVNAWIAANAAAQQRTNDAALTVLLALSALYSVIAVVNAIVIAGSGRRREHAIARLSGLTRAQVIGTTALEGALVTATGLVLGTVVVVCALTGVAVAADHSVGTAVVAVPWGLYFATLGGRSCSAFSSRRRSRSSRPASTQSSRPAHASDGGLTHAGAG